MTDLISLSNGRATTALGFGCASLLRIPDSTERQRLLSIAYEAGIRHFDVARFYGLGHSEAVLSGLLKTHPDQITVSTKFGIGSADPPSTSTQSQAGLRALLRKAPGLRTVARRIYSGRRLPRNFTVAHCRQSLHTSLNQLGIEAVDLLLLHEPTLSDQIDPDLETTLKTFQSQGLIGSFGLSGNWSDCESLIATRPLLAIHMVQWEDDLFEAAPDFNSRPSSTTTCRGRFGRIRRSLPRIQQAFEAVPQLQRYWSDRMNINLADSVSLGAALLGAALATYPSELLLYSSTDADRLRRTLTLLNNPPWHNADAIAFESFWRPRAKTRGVA
jgi:diketogulonate reductase-like aldo/keto reductase